MDKVSKKADGLGVVTTIWFVVLHYGPVDKTIRCVNSLLQQDNVIGINCNVLIVENGYVPARDDKLSELYGARQDVAILQSVDNLGFSGGNNLGYRYVREQSPDDCSNTIALFLNNDTEIPDKRFVSKLVYGYTESSFDVLSPDVFDPSVQQHQSPLCKGSEIDRYAEMESMRAKALIEEHGIKKIRHFFKNTMYNFFRLTKLGKRVIAKRRMCDRSSCAWMRPADDVVPQGSAVIFGPSYLKASDVAFDECTFMYYEECILKIKCDRLGLSIRYEPSLQVLHYHSEITLRSLFANNPEKRRKQAQWTLDSYQVYLDYCKTDEIFSQKLAIR